MLPLLPAEQKILLQTAELPGLLPGFHTPLAAGAHRHPRSRPVGSQSGTRGSCASPGLKQQWKCNCWAHAGPADSCHFSGKVWQGAQPGFPPDKQQEAGRSRAVLGALSSSSVWAHPGKAWSNGIACETSALSRFLSFSLDNNFNSLFSGKDPPPARYLHCMYQALQMALLRRILSLHWSFNPLKFFHFGETNLPLQQNRQQFILLSVFLSPFLSRQSIPLKKPNCQHIKQQAMLGQSQLLLSTAHRAKSQRWTQSRLLHEN